MSQKGVELTLRSPLWLFLVLANYLGHKGMCVSKSSDFKPSPGADEQKDAIFQGLLPGQNTVSGEVCILCNI